MITSLSQTNRYYISHEYLGMEKLFEKLMPHFLTIQQKWTKQFILHIFIGNKTNFVTIDETRI